jgi:peptidoglycan/LPS O-acetylase OafA/YrhL
VASTPDRTSYLPTLDGWRAIAILMVVTGHAAKPAFCDGSMPLTWCKYLLLGGHGVALFFALSGFLITSRLLNEYDRNGAISLRGFYRRRVFRILPAALALLTALSVLGAMNVLPIAPIEIISSLFFFRNYVPLFMGDGGEGFYTALFWSLAVEEHFYLFWPLLLALTLPRRRAFAVTIALAAVIAVWRRLDGHYQWVQQLTDLPQYQFYYRTDTRLDALLWGCVLALVLRDAHARGLAVTLLRPPVWVVLLITYAVGIALGWRGVLWHTLLAPPLIVGTLLHPDALPGRVLELAPARWIGRISYSLYLWHPLVMPQITAAMVWPAVQTLPVNVLFAFGLAAMSYYGIEKPMIERGRRIKGGGPLH